MITTVRCERCCLKGARVFVCKDNQTNMQMGSRIGSSGSARFIPFDHNLPYTW